MVAPHQHGPLERTMPDGSQAVSTTETGNQYSLARILSIWALAAVPMGLLSWIVFPALSPDVGSDPLEAGVLRIGFAHVRFDLVVCPLPDHRQAGGGQSSLDDRQAQAPTQCAARSSDR